MALTNAERQARHRKKHRGDAGLTVAQIAERDAVRAGTLLPIRIKDGGPTFMGLSPSGWRGVPAELADHFGMREAWDRWQAEWADHLARCAEASDRAPKIVAEVGRRASKIMRERGALALCEAYDADPRLGTTRRTA